MSPDGVGRTGIPAGVAGFVSAARRHLSGFSREGFSGIILILGLFVSLFYLATRADRYSDISVSPQSRQGFHSSGITQGLSLQDTARNWKYYQIMTSVCHRHGQPEAAAAYAYLFYSANRYSLSGKWSSEQFDAAVDSAEGYYEINPAIDCRPGSANLHGLDEGADPWLMTRALNYVFYSNKVPVCEQAGNKLQARTYGYLADSERAKLNDPKWTAIQVNAAIAGARESPDLHGISGC